MIVLKFAARAFVAGELRNSQVCVSAQAERARAGGSFSRTASTIAWKNSVPLRWRDNGPAGRLKSATGMPQNWRRPSAAQLIFRNCAVIASIILMASERPTRARDPVANSCHGIGARSARDGTTRWWIPARAASEPRANARRRPFSSDL